VGYDVSEWDDRRKNAWIFENTDLTVEMVAAAAPQPNVRTDLMRLLRGKKVTAYNVPFDLGKFLYRDPWRLRGAFRECTDIMAAATEVCKLPSQFYEVKYRFPKLDHAYSAITEGDPAGIEGKQDHRALSDARMASHLMIGMFRGGDYFP
jgi:DNA polymerase-3 subunit epsilon